jgi:hypothetical protein
MIRFQTEKISDTWQEAIPLQVAHWDEVAHYKDIKLNPDFPSYLELERAGIVRCFTAREDGKLIGYVIFFVRPNLHYCQSIQALQDVLFLSPEKRLGRTGVEMIIRPEKPLASQGVQVVYHHVKAGSNMGRLLPRLGYELIDEVYGKRLDR